MKQKNKDKERLKEKNNIERFQEKLKSQKAITLVALVITIVILIILATVTINVLLGEGGLINQAKTAKEMTTNSSIAEQEQLNELFEWATNSIEEESEVEPPVIEGVITIEPAEWQGDGTASVTISSNKEEYKIEYRVDKAEGNDVEWTEIQNGETISSLKHGDVVFARITDGKNYGDEASVNILDGIEPNVANLTVTAADETSIAVLANGEDNETGVYSYTYQKSTTSSTSGFDSGVTHTNSANSDTYTFTELENGITYYLRVIVTDKAKNTKTSTVVTQVAESANTAPTAPTVTYSSKTNTTLTVTAKSTDVDGDDLNYTLYAGETSGNLNKVSSVVTKQQNQTATLTVSGLTSYVEYYWRVDVSDGKATTQGQEQSKIRTYCYTTPCSGGYSVSNGKSCSKCGGDGSISSTKSCTDCGGNGNIGDYTFTAFRRSMEDWWKR